MSKRNRTITRTPFQIALRRLKKHRMAISGFWVLVALYTLAIFADFFAPYSFDDEKRENSYHPPTKIHLGIKDNRLCLYVYKYEQKFDKFYRRLYYEDKTQIYPVKFFYKGDAYKLLGIFRTRIHLFGVDEPARIYLFGADSRGRDLFSRILHGSRISLSIGLVGVSISFLLGMFVGGIAGYFGGKLDNFIMRICEIIMMVPGFYLMLTLRATFPAGLSSVQIYFLIVIILSFIGWAGLARVIRGMTLSLREKEFVISARTCGLNHLKIIYRHILPNLFSYIIVAVTLSIPGYILGESALSLIGLGIQDPYASWGNLLSEAMAISEIQKHPWILIPGIFIFITVSAFNLLGDGLRDAFDPQKYQT
ncbi:MAG: ABC transporter permease [Candidatus Omnitrophota bacterium]